jgi:hypothetical protein
MSADRTKPVQPPLFEAEDGGSRERTTGNECPKCHATIPEGKLACPDCTEGHSRATYLEFQKSYLPFVVTGKHILRITRVRESPWHLVLIGDPRHAYCGHSVGEGWRTKRQSMLEPMPEPRICTLCKEVFDRLCAEAGVRREVAGART